MIRVDAQGCMKRLERVGDLSFATVGKDGTPQVRIVSAVLYEDDALYFFTARGKDFCQELLSDGRVQILGYTPFYEMIRVSGKAEPLPEEEQKLWIDKIFDKFPSVKFVYPRDTREIGIIFTIKDMAFEYFNLSGHPIFRESYIIGRATLQEKGYEISENCIACGACLAACPQSCIKEGKPYIIIQENCLHCGNCLAHCPANAIEERH